MAQFSSCRCNDRLAKGGYATRPISTPPSLFGRTEDRDKPTISQRPYAIVTGGRATKASAARALGGHRRIKPENLLGHRGGAELGGHPGTATGPDCMALGVG